MVIDVFNVIKNIETNPNGTTIIDWDLKWTDQGIYTGPQS